MVPPLCTGGLRIWPSVPNDVLRLAKLFKVLFSCCSCNFGSLTVNKPFTMGNNHLRTFSKIV